MISERDVLAALPQESCFLTNYVGFCMERTAAHLGFHVGVGLTLLSQAVPPTLTLPFSSPLAGHLFVMLVGSSSKAYKTSAINQGLRILNEVAPDMILETPGSREALIDAVRARPHGAIIYPEFGDFLSSSYGDRSYARAMKTAFTSIYDATPLGRSLVKKKGDGKLDAPKPALDPRLSILAGVATPFLESYTEGPDWSGGFLGRFFTIYADPERKFSGEPLDDPEGREAIVNRYRELHYLHGSRMIRPGRCLWLSEAGAARWHAFNEDMEKRRQNAHASVDAACSRAVAMAAKIALLLSWDLGHARTGQPWKVPTELVESAIRLATLHLESVALLADRIVTGKDMQDRRTVLDAVPPGRVVRLGDVLRKAQMLKRRCLEILDTLVEEKTLVMLRVPNGGAWFTRKTEPELMSVVYDAITTATKAHEAASLEARKAAREGKVVPLAEAMIEHGDAYEGDLSDDFGSLPLEHMAPAAKPDDAHLAFPGAGDGGNDGA